MTNSPHAAALMAETAPGFGHNSGETPSTEAPSTAPDLLRGAGEICIELWGEDTPAARRRLYYEADRWPLFRLEDDGVLHASRSRLRAFIAMKSAESEAKIAAAAARSETEIISRQSKRRRSQGHRKRRAPETVD
jgi:hypothetical protein